MQKLSTEAGGVITLINVETDIYDSVEINGTFTFWTSEANQIMLSNEGKLIVTSSLEKVQISPFRGRHDFFREVLQTQISG